MGQARNRGTFEERRAAAIEAREAAAREAQLEEQRREAALPPTVRIARREARHRDHMHYAAMTGLIAGLSLPGRYR